MSTTEKFVLYGGPILPANKIRNNSLGGFLLEKLKSLGDSVLLVSILVFNRVQIQNNYDNRH